MTLLFLTLKTFSATGGIEKFNRCFSKALWENGLEQGWKVEVFSAYDGLPDANYLPAQHFKGFDGNRSRYFAAAIASMRRADIIIFSHINLAPLMRFCQVVFPGKKTICMAHGREVWEPLSKLQSGALKNCKSIWAVSQFTANILTTEKGVPEGNTRLYYNTLDPFFATSHPDAGKPRSLKERYGIGPGEKVILTVARLAATEKFKGYDAVLKALPAICQQFAGTRYVLCGKWDEGEKKRIDLLINELKLHNVVILTGFIEDAELVGHYQMADVFVLPSRKEGFGIVFLEAAWWGIPVIGGNKDGSVEALLGGQLGMLIDPGDPAQLEGALIKAMQQPLSPQVRENQRKLVESNFGFDQFKKRQLRLLNEMR